MPSRKKYILGTYLIVDFTWTNIRHTYRLTMQSVFLVQDLFVWVFVQRAFWSRIMTRDPK